MRKNRDSKILIIDDDKELLENLYKYLNTMGFEKVLIAKNLAEAEFKIMNNKLDLIVLDLMLPDGSGFDLLKSMRKKSKEYEKKIESTGHHSIGFRWY